VDADDIATGVVICTDVTDTEGQTTAWGIDLEGIRVVAPVRRNLVSWDEVFCVLTVNPQ
jgi:hypothetical protein